MRGIIPRLDGVIQYVHLFLEETREVVHLQSKEALEEFNIMGLNKVEVLNNKPLEINH